jgi:hypothetical protein
MQPVCLVRLSSQVPLLRCSHSVMSPGVELLESITGESRQVRLLPSSPTHLCGGDSNYPLPNKPGSVLAGGQMPILSIYIYIYLGYTYIYRSPSALAALGLTLSPMSCVIPSFLPPPHLDPPGKATPGNQPYPFRHAPLHRPSQ